MVSPNMVLLHIDMKRKDNNIRSVITTHETKYCQRAHFQSAPLLFWNANIFSPLCHNVYFFFFFTKLSSVQKYTVLFLYVKALCYFVHNSNHLKCWRIYLEIKGILYFIPTDKMFLISFFVKSAKNYRTFFQRSS